MAIPKKADAPQQAGGEVATCLLDWARKAERKSAKSISQRPWDKARAEVEGMIRTGEWASAGPRHFAAAYEVLHEMVYGVVPGEMTPKGRLQVAGMAGSMLRREFDDNPVVMADYVRWLWTREKSREEWRRSNGRMGARLTPGIAFGPTALTDYRIEQQRRRPR